MKISRIRAYRVELPMSEGSYRWAGQSFAAFDTTVVIMETDGGLCGIGEVCPLGPAYLPSYAEGARAVIAKIAPDLLGENPLEIDRLNFLMDSRLKGHFYAKSALDMACWDILGKAAQLPLYALLGGKFQERVKLFKVVSHGAPEKMAAKLGEYRARGFSHYQVKVGGGDLQADLERLRRVAAAVEPGEVLAFDGNTGFLQHQAMRFAQAAAGGDGVYLEQPCATYEECLAVRRASGLPMILDECIDTTAALLRALSDRAADVVNLKISRIGGISKLRRFRDLCVQSGIAMTIEDSWGSAIATAAIAHLGHSTPPGFHFQSSPFHDYTPVVTAEGAPEIEGGFMRAADAPGLGVSPLFDALGKPVLEIAASGAR